jgi:hypothetical protein
MQISFSSNNITTINQDNYNQNEEETQIASPQPTGTELRQLQRENDQLYHDVAKRSEEIHAISTQVV